MGKMGANHLRKGRKKGKRDEVRKTKTERQPDNHLADN